MSRGTQLRRLLVVALAVAIGAPSIAAADRRDGRSSGARRAAPARTAPARPPRAQPTRPRVRDHRGTVVRPPRPSPEGRRPVYWPYYYRHGYWPYYGYYGHHYPYGGYYAGYYAPGYSEPVAAPPPPPRRSGIAAGFHLGQLERDDDVPAALGGVALRWRGGVVDAEIELARRVFADRPDAAERSLAGTLYLNLGDVDSLHPYLLAGAGFLDGDRVFGAVGAGLALPLTWRVSLAGDVRAASIGARDDRRMRDADARTLEGRLGLVIDL